MHDTNFTYFNYTEVYEYIESMGLDARKNFAYIHDMVHFVFALGVTWEDEAIVSIIEACWSSGDENFIGTTPDGEYYTGLEKICGFTDKYKGNVPLALSNARKIFEANGNRNTVEVMVGSSMFNVRDIVQDNDDACGHFVEAMSNHEGN